MDWQLTPPGALGRVKARHLPRVAQGHKAKHRAASARQLTGKGVAKRKLQFGIYSKIPNVEFS